MSIDDLFKAIGFFSASAALIGALLTGFLCVLSIDSEVTKIRKLLESRAPKDDGDKP